MSPLSLTHRDTVAGPVLLVVGELDFVHAAELRRQVEGLVLHAGQRLVLDLSGVEFCDSTGITALLAARQHALAAEAEVVLAAVPAHLERILTIVGLVRVFTLRATAEDT
ncbi:STAS domain-containing protein [Streptomyces griseoaurantiacus]|uniref:Anti-sigma factor antagonist n=1 Tax=Streptomyces griseoaurantiacus TaxID=68213 RepID=A0A1G7MM80_9ACTN|nr:STAS domain-containing protein [Streptomyces jietaisiensis]SDF62726.1 anti-anti-sigma factor [Streptomyces jietaisiensis]